jgi:hypothetical protein
MVLVAVKSTVLYLCQSAQPGPEPQTDFYLMHIAGLKSAEL